MTVLTREIALQLVAEQGTDVVIPDIYTVIGNEAFQRTGLTSVVIPDGITIIKKGAFGSTLLASVIIPGSVKEIGKSAFRFNRQLTNVLLSNGVEIIGRSAFAETSLDDIVIPDSVREIQAFTFDSSGLNNVVLPRQLQAIGAFAFRNNSLNTLEIPSTVVRIGKGAFLNNSLMTLDIPEGVVNISQNAFRKNSLNSLSIPESVTSIGSRAFFNNNLAAVEISGQFNFDPRFIFDPQVDVPGINQVPFDITLSRSKFNNLSKGDVVGTLRALDPDAGDSGTFSLEPDLFVQGGNDSDAFIIEGDKLIFNKGTFGVRESFSILVRAVDSGGLARSAVVTLTQFNELESDSTISLKGRGADALLLTGNQSINGQGDGNDNRLEGNDANNLLNGLAGRDILIGNGGRDILKGGKDDDTFIFKQISDSGTTNKIRDTITDFTAGEDLIDLSQIDANPFIDGDQAFEFIGAANFTEAGQVRFADGLLSANTEGDLKADFQVKIKGVTELFVGSLVL